ncbi:hypothetical protein MBLNU457_6325t1 [Dothideomycetes sp. NU457]
MIGGPTISTYAVQDKRQVADLDPSMLIEEDLLDEPEDPCMLCGQYNSSYEIMYCDGCDRAAHVFCAGTEDFPEVWYCSECLQALDENETVVPGRTSRRTHRSRTTTTQGEPRRTGGRRSRRPDAWARVWQSVWDRLNLDLDFPFDEESTTEIPRTAAQRRELNVWQQRLQVASRQGAANRFRHVASSILQPPAPAPESQEELRAWNAFDKARDQYEEQTASRPSNRRKRQSETASPASPRGQEATEERKLKRPRTRRNDVDYMDGNGGASSSSRAPAQRPVEAPSFLTSLLQEVERQPLPSDHASPDATLTDGQLSPPMSSPIMSPMPSNHPTPRAASLTPPPFSITRNSSPMPLTSIVRPAISPITRPISYSPFSPAEPSREANVDATHRGRTNVRQAPQNSSPQSPSGRLSYSTKNELQRMVKNALGPRYRDQEITKDQYTDINRDISHMLYDHVEDAKGLEDQSARDKLQEMANSEVEKAIEAIRAQH